MTLTERQIMAREVSYGYGRCTDVWRTPWERRVGGNLGINGGKMHRAGLSKILTGTQ